MKGPVEEGNVPGGGTEGQLGIEESATLGGDRGADVQQHPDVLNGCPGPGQGTF